MQHSEGEQKLHAVKGYFVSDALSGKIPTSQLGLDITWHQVPVRDASVFRALEYDLIATTDAAFGRACENFALPVSHLSPTKPIIRMDLQHENLWSSHLDKLIAQTMPTRCLGLIPPRSAHIADHVFFAPKNQSFYDILLMQNACNNMDIRRRFRQWSTHLHPDRFELKKSTHPGLISRLEFVYDRVCKAYRALNSPYKRALHDHWLKTGDNDRAVALDESGPIAEIHRMSEEPEIRTQLIRVLSLTEAGDWHEAVTKLHAGSSTQPQNRELKTFMATLSQISEFIEQEGGNTSLN